MLTKDDFIKQISGISDVQWDTLFEFIPVFERMTDFGSWTTIEKLGDGVYTMPHYMPSSVVMDFERHLYAIDLILSYDWMKWQEGIEMLQNDDANFDDLDTLTLCKLITMILRNDRFTEGYLLNCFENGLILKLLKNLERKVLLGD